jgi:hypothetical protein
MPRGDGRGPFAGGSGRGPGMGGGGGRGMGMGRGRRGNAGPGGNCICPACGEKVMHQAGVPCTSMSCPKCGMRMVRE